MIYWTNPIWQKWTSAAIHKGLGFNLRKMPECNDRFILRPWSRGKLMATVAVCYTCCYLGPKLKGWYAVDGFICYISPGPFERFYASLNSLYYFFNISSRKIFGGGGDMNITRNNQSLAKIGTDRKDSSNNSQPANSCQRQHKCIWM